MAAFMLLNLSACQPSGQNQTKQYTFEQKEKPNIIFLFTDDQRFNTISALGNPEVITPNMDNLVVNGLTFSNAYVMGAKQGAVSMPSRAMLMTGRHLFHLEQDGATIPNEHLILPEVLRKHGYRTFATGKWHNGRQAFARAFTDGDKIFFGGMSDHDSVPVYDFQKSGEYPDNLKYYGEKFSSELFTDAAINFLTHYTDTAPFFMYVSYTAPHDPRMAPKRYTAMYDTAHISLPPNFMPQHPFDNGEMMIRDERLAAIPRQPAEIKQHILAYYAMITHLDMQIGRLLETLKQTEQLDNTIILLAGDNGLAVGQHGLMGKQNLYEHSIRVPFIIKGPGIPKAEKRETLCYLYDIYPTLCELAGIGVPKSVDGKSLKEVIQDKNVETRESLYFAYSRYQRAVRADNWKLITYHVNGMDTSQLFNLDKDPWEKVNLYDSTLFSDEQKLLKKHMKQWLTRTDDTLFILEQ